MPNAEYCPALSSMPPCHLSVQHMLHHIASLQCCGHYKSVSLPQESRARILRISFYQWPAMPSICMVPMSTEGCLLWCPSFEKCVKSKDPQSPSSENQKVGLPHIHSSLRKNSIERYTCLQKRRLR